MPIGIRLPEEMKRAERLAEGTPLVASFAAPLTPVMMKHGVDELLGFVGSHNVPFVQRQRQAGVALEWIDQLAEKPKTNIYDLRPLVPAVERALGVPALQDAAIPALASLGTASGQRALLDVANRGTQSLVARQGAAAAFWRSVQLHGILLTHAEIARQYGFYNASPGGSRRARSVRIDPRYP